MARRKRTEKQKAAHSAALVVVCESHPRCTPEQIRQIINQRLAGVGVRNVAENVGVDKDTVSQVYKDYLAEGVAIDVDEVDLNRQEAIERAELGYSQAMTAIAAHLLENPDTAAKFFGPAQRAELTLIELRGLKSAAKVEVAGPDGGPVELLWREEIVATATEGASTDPT